MNHYTSLFEKVTVAIDRYPDRITHDPSPTNSPRLFIIDGFHCERSRLIDLCINEHATRSIPIRSNALAPVKVRLGYGINFHHN